MKTIGPENIYCVSSEPVKWIFGYNSDQMPRMNRSEFEYESSTSKDQQFCLTLKVLKGYQSWIASTTFVKCVTNRTGNGSSRWYELRRWKFGPREIAFNPKVIPERIEGSSSTSHNVSPRADEEAVRTLNQIPDACATRNSSCYHVLSSHKDDHVQILRCKVPEHEQKRSLFICLSSEPIKWIFGSNSSQLPRINSSALQLGSLEDQQFCLSLRIIFLTPPWKPSVLFAKCVTNRTSDSSSRWYSVERDRFESKGYGFNPTVTSDSKNSSNEVVNPTEAPPNSNMTAAQAKIANVHVAVVIGTAGGAAAFVTLLLIVVVILMKKVKRQQKQIEMTNAEIDEFMLGVAAEKANAKGINGLFVLPYDTRLEVPKTEVLFRSTVLGSGAFGQVVKGSYQGDQVAIKMLKNNASQNADYLRSLLGELKVMSYLGSHPHLVGLIGAITRNVKKGEAYLIFEYCSRGNAHRFVRDHRDTFVNLLASQAPSGPPATKTATRLSRLSKFYSTPHHGTRLTTKNIVRWCYEVASGMEYVSSKNVYHGDLAARNILLMEDLTAKVGDFGLSKQLDVEQYNCYVQKKECPLPLKWMAIESLRDLTFSIQSDVWSFGVTMWELFTLGAVPYPGMDWNFESWKLLCEGKRLDRPEYASDSLYNIMMSCWSADPKSRPAFANLRDLLNAELSTL